MQYRSIADLNVTLRQNAWRLGQPVDLVVGIPRSGLLAANMLSLLLNVPMTDLEGYLAGRTLMGGKRMKLTAARDGARVVVVDDSVLTGSAIREARARIESAAGDSPTYVAVYGENYTHKDVDLVFEKVAPPRVFEWNLMHHPVLKQSCVDIDGVLCVDPAESDNDDGPKYLKFISGVEPLCIPTLPVGQIVTTRLEKYRSQTEAWLQRWGVQYDDLRMLDLPDAASRKSANAYSSFKAGVYAQSKAVLFIESDHRYAREIAEIAQKPVLCMCCGQLMQPGATQLIHSLRSANASAFRQLKLRLRRTLGNKQYERLRGIVR